MIDHEDRYRCEAAEGDIVHPRACRLVKGVGHSPVLVEVRAVADAGAERGWRHQARSWALGRDGWMSKDMLLSEEAWKLDTAQVADALSETFYPFIGEHPETVGIGGALFDEIVQEHDTNYLIALAVAVDMLQGPAGRDRVADRIRANADADMSVRMGRAVEVGAPAHEDGYTLLDPADERDAAIIEAVKGAIRSERYDEAPREVLVYPDDGRTVVADNTYGHMHVEGFASEAVAKAYAGDLMGLDEAHAADRVAEGLVGKSMRETLQALCDIGDIDEETLAVLTEEALPGIDEVEGCARDAVGARDEGAEPCEGPARSDGAR